MTTGFQSPLDKRRGSHHQVSNFSVISITPPAQTPWLTWHESQNIPRRNHQQNQPVSKSRNCGANAGVGHQLFP